ncbi:MAG: hypothetical protein ABIY55_23000 [Kofleriaceae bacterium]
MTASTSFLRNPFVSLTLLTTGVLAAGCIDPTGPAADPAADQLEQAVISGAVVDGASPGLAAAIGQLEIHGDHITMASPGWTQTVPGQWTGAGKSGSASVVVGAEGHRRAIADTTHAIAALREAGAAADEIQRQQAYLARLEVAALEISDRGAVPQAVSCNLGFVIDASSLLIPGFVGEFAGVQLVCTGGTQVFTVQAQACTDFGCGAVSTFTPTIGAVPQLFGTATQGTAGASCFGIAAVTPPGVSASRTNPCG